MATPSDVTLKTSALPLAASTNVTDGPSLEMIARSLLTRTFSGYVPGWTMTVSSGSASSIASWITWYLYLKAPLGSFSLPTWISARQEARINKTPYWTGNIERLG